MHDGSHMSTPVSCWGWRICYISLSCAGYVSVLETRWIHSSQFKVKHFILLTSRSRETVSMRVPPKISNFIFPFWKIVLVTDCVGSVGSDHLNGASQNQRADNDEANTTFTTETEEVVFSKSLSLKLCKEVPFESSVKSQVFFFYVSIFSFLWRACCQNVLMLLAPDWLKVKANTSSLGVYL